MPGRGASSHSSLAPQLSWWSRVYPAASTSTLPLQRQGRRLSGRVDARAVGVKRTGGTKVAGGTQGTGLMAGIGAVGPRALALAPTRGRLTVFHPNHAESVACFSWASAAVFSMFG